METNSLATAVALSDQDLLSRIAALAGNERETTAELVAHLAALELRPSLYEAQGYGTLFAYCTEALRLSEDAACNRIEAARVCRRFPLILDLLSSGSVTLTAVRRLGKHLTPENHEAVLARARHQKKEQIDALVAELAPRPDVASSVRKLPAAAASSAGQPEGLPTGGSTPGLSHPPAAPLLGMLALGDPRDLGTAGDGNRPVPLPPIDSATPRLAPTPPPSAAPRPIVQPLAPGRYRVQFTIGQEAHDKLRRLQALLRRELPNGDPGAIFERFIDVLLDKVERKKLGKRGPAKTTTNPRQSRKAGARGRASAETGAADRAYENRIRSGTDRTDPRDTPTGPIRSGTDPIDPQDTAIGLEGRRAQPERQKKPTRYIPNAVKRAVWFRDRGQCAFVADTGHRCSERSFLELHHIQCYAMGGPATVGNMSLRCRRHNQYEADLVFGVRRVAQT